MKVSEIGSARTSARSTKAPGAWNAAWDVWVSSSPDSPGENDDTEVMVWANQQGGPTPIGEKVGTITPLAPGDDQPATAPGDEQPAPKPGGDQGGAPAPAPQPAAGAGADALVGAASRRCVDVVGRSVDKGAPLQLRDCQEDEQAMRSPPARETCRRAETSAATTNESPVTLPPILTTAVLAACEVDQTFGATGSTPYRGGRRQQATPS